MTADERVPTGIAGLDTLLHGGLLPGRAYMVHGDAGSGKTVFGYHFLTNDPDADALYVALEESERDVTSNAASMGFDLSSVDVLDLSPNPEEFLETEQYSVFAPDEVEHEDVYDRIRSTLRERDYDRVFVDPLSHLRHLSPDDYQFRQEVAALASYLKSRGTTLVFTTQPTERVPDDDLEFLSDGAVELSRSPEGRSLEVVKFRGSDFVGGHHSMRISGEGILVFPKLVPAAHTTEFERGQLSTGLEELDALLGGGIERGTVTMVSGPTGVGKSTTASQIVSAAAARGERSAMYLFEETRSTFLERSSGVSIAAEEMVESGDLYVEAVEPLALSADEFANRVRSDVEEHGTELVVIDGTSGYRLSVHDDQNDLVRELHALCRYLRNVGVTVVLTEEVTDVTGGFRASNFQISYIADNILFMRYYEHQGEIRKAVGVLKKRLGDFESTLRAFEITGDGLEVGDRLSGLRGVLTGTPDYDD